MKQTENFGLKQIESSDLLSATPLNENAALIDTVLQAQKNEILGRVMMACGSYTGDGTKSAAIQTPGFKPIAVLMKPKLREHGYTISTDLAGSTHVTARTDQLAVDAGWCLWIGGNLRTNFGLITFDAQVGSLSWYMTVGDEVDYAYYVPDVMNNGESTCYEWIAFGVAED